MKLKSVVGLLLLLSCSPSDNFSDTKRIIATDKDEYRLGDHFELTLTIQSLNKEKKIRIYKNFKNIEISFSLVNSADNILNENWSNHSGQFLSDSEIIEVTIDKGKPLTKTFKGEIIDDKKMVTLSIPELNMKVSFDKEKVMNGTSIRVHGFCSPIDPGAMNSLEDYFEIKDIRIIEE